MTPQQLRQEIKSLNRYIIQFEEEVKRWRMGRTLKIVEEVLNDKV
jgi:hypothetical protein